MTTNKKRYKGKGLFKVLIFSVISLAFFDVIFGVLGETLLSTQEEGNYAKYNEIFNDSCSEIVILGNSRAERQFVSEVVEERTGKTAYNGGLGGRDILFFNAVRKGVLSQCKPKVFILEFQWNSLAIPVKEELLSFLHPFYFNVPEIQSQLDQGDLERKLLFRSSLFRFNSVLWDLISSYFKNDKIKKGYRPLFGNLRENQLPELDQSDQLIEFKTRNLELYKKFIISSISQGIKVVLVSSPQFFKESKVDQSQKDEFLDFLDSSGVHYLDYRHDQYYLGNKDIFHDIRHLNKEGAKLFTIQLSEDLKKLSLN